MPLCLLLRLLLRMHLEELQDDDETANFGTPPHLQDIFPPSDEEHEPDSGPIAADDTYEQYLPKPGVTLFLESCSLDSHTLRGVRLREGQEQGH